ncbi:C13 family peptidase [Novosphingobium sp. MD-1]|uniref:C13 family peptidase n=1 Tax=Novosphingobium sp. MD-1 TaxID=1630648 RepID=UPI00061CC297|nr:C13 family peptidase [Novosphingobium sp. MD-1]GAO54997.1 MORN repeat family protein [Novosphingobium sp. MD-1]
MIPVPRTAHAILRFLALRRIVLGDLPSNPALLALLWVATSVINVIDAVMIRRDEYIPPSLALHYSGSLVLTALIAAWAIGRRTDAIRLAIAFMLVGLVVAVGWFTIALLTGDDSQAGELCRIGLGLWAGAAAITLLRRGWGQSRSHRGTVIALIFAATVGFITMEMPSFDSYLMPLSPQFREARNEIEDTAPVSPEILWPMQPELVEATAISLRPQDMEHPPVRVVAVAAGGSQQLFGREAKAALTLLRGRFGPRTPGALLSNARLDLTHVPLATNANFSTLLRQATMGTDLDGDLIVIYLAGHGSRDAALRTDLPDYQPLIPISARSLARSLDEAGIRRRIVIVSACYAGTWIKPLASPDTIVITAAAADRTSFGCDDRRQYTVFGEAFISGPLRGGASLQEAFEYLKKRVAAEEAKEGATPSLPQAYVGDRMREIWAAASSVAVDR